ncbi:MAG: hypothetical protein RID53_16835 [Coleofasciculus sp. B1-GNL1-01]|uniref:hypothetical protein n=1 Tax=Coleofasciculus sp. B1-GNL1-01 TaxID=3068484 RepID=UPI0032FE85EF
MYSLHRRQFVVGSKPFTLDHWCSKQLDPLTWISFCPELRLSVTTDAEGIPWCLVGRAVETLEAQADPLTAIPQTSSRDVPSLYPSWAGRWVLIGQGQMHLDASGLLGCFYGVDQNREGWCSSSPSLLTSILFPEVPPKTDPKTLKYKTGIAWFIPPRSRFEGIRRLLPSQVLTIRDATLDPRALMPPINPSLDYNHALELLKSSLVTGLKRLANQENQLWLGLSAGYDSRVVLAIARYAGIDLKTFTRVTPRMSLADRILPPQLAELSGYEHFFLKKRQGHPERQHLATTHTNGHVSQGDAQPFIHGVRSSLQGICIGGQCFGVGKVLYRSFPEQISDPEETACHILHIRQEPLLSSTLTALTEWLEWVLQTPHEHLDWRDRFYIEQRLAGWQSSKEQLYDLDDVERFFPINSSRNYSLLLSIEEKRRLNFQHQVELIQRIAPELLNYPINPDNWYFGMVRGLYIRLLDDPLYLFKKISNKFQK